MSWRGFEEEVYDFDSKHCLCDPPTPHAFAVNCSDCLERLLRRAYAAGMRHAAVLSCVDPAGDQAEDIHKTADAISVGEGET